MCGIIGYIGKRNALEVVLQALKRLEYRGYDSAGVAISTSTGLQVVKKTGRLANLLQELTGKESEFAGKAGIGHTRWATHGRPTDKNAHPHLDSNRKIALVHNGIIENSSELRDKLEKQGIEFSSDTDSEVAVRLMTNGEIPIKNEADFIDRVYSTLNQLTGAFTLVFTHADFPELIVAARRSTPLVLGVGEGEMWLASDVAAFIDYTTEAVELADNQVVVIRANGYEVTNFDGTPSAGNSFVISWDLAEAEKSGYPYFMTKEIDEQPEAIIDTLRGHFSKGRIILDEQRLNDDDLRDVDKVFIIACGSAFHAGLIAKYVIEHWTRLPCEVELASEFRYRDPVLDQSTLVVAISQSGETADTLEAVRHAKEQGVRVLAISNTNGSIIAREADAVLYTRAGPEIAVASTKAFLAQVAAGYLVALALAQARGTKYADEVAREFKYLEAMPAKLRLLLKNMDQVRNLAERHYKTQTVLFVGRHVGYPVALEGALKLKELAYIHAEGFAAGELKHGTIALIEDGLPVFVCVPPKMGHPVLHAKMLNNIKEIQARGAYVIALAEQNDIEVINCADEVIELPVCPTLLQPLLTVVPLQVFAATVAILKGYDVDKPRNLAKSVTVE